MSRDDDALVDFLLRETGDRLHVVVQYDAATWQYRYVRNPVLDRIENWDVGEETVVDRFRREAAANAERTHGFGLGTFHCSLHLFDEVLILHFSQPDGAGLLIGFDPAAAANLTDFVEECLPYVREHALPDVDDPEWAS